MHLAQTELAVVGVEKPIPADLVFQWQGFRFELDAILARDIGPHIQRRRLLFVRMTELKHDFRIAHREAVDIGDAPPQDKGVVVKTKIRSVAESDFSDIRPQPGLRVGDKANTRLLGRALHELAEITEALYRREAIGLQDELGFEVLDYVVGMAVGVSCSVTVIFHLLNES